jgi:hypothetical protein
MRRGTSCTSCRSRTGTGHYRNYSEITKLGNTGHSVTLHPVSVFYQYVKLKLSKNVVYGDCL